MRFPNRRLAAALAEDRGVTLIEVVTVISIMSVFLAMFTTGIIQMYRYANRQQAISTARAQVNTAFLRLDTELRYAEAISVPGPAGGAQFVEYLLATEDGPTCVELRLAAELGLLQRRTWPQGAWPVQPTPWHTLASQVSSAQPFTLISADQTVLYQRLELRVTARAGTGGTATSAETQVTFTALNSAQGGQNPTICTEGRTIS